MRLSWEGARDRSAAGSCSCRAPAGAAAPFRALLLARLAADGAGPA